MYCMEQMSNKIRSIDVVKINKRQNYGKSSPGMMNQVSQVIRKLQLPEDRCA
jgi:hypothetical protein